MKNKLKCFYRNWKVNEKSPKFQYFLDFVITVSNLNFRNMNKLKSFADDSELNSADFLDIALKMKGDIPLPDKKIFAHVITEASSTILTPQDSIIIELF